MAYSHIENDMRTQKIDMNSEIQSASFYKTVGTQQAAL